MEKYNLLNDRNTNSSNVSVNKVKSNFTGDIVIIDPITIITDEEELVSYNYGLAMEEAGFNNYICGSFNLNNQEHNILTCYEDVDEEKILGKFIVDSCCIGIFYLEDIERYNSDFSISKAVFNKEAVLIKNFNGKIGIFKGEISNEIFIVGKGNRDFFINPK